MHLPRSIMYSPQACLPKWTNTHRAMDQNSCPYVKQFGWESTKLQTHWTDSITSTTDSGGKKRVVLGGHHSQQKMCVTWTPWSSGHDNIAPLMNGIIMQPKFQSWYYHDHSIITFFTCSVPDDFKVNPGAVESVAQHPTDDSKVINAIIYLINRPCIDSGKNQFRGTPSSAVRGTDFKLQ